jgi:hypothetical protein
MLSELESEASAVLARWLQAIEDVPPGTGVIEAADRPTMSQYLATQALRTSEERTLLGQGPGSALEIADLQTLHVAMLAAGAIQEAAAAVSNFVWILARNESGVVFYTSDHPVVLRTHDHHCLHFFQFSLPGTEVLLPLSSTVMFYAYDRSHWKKLAPFDGQVSPVRFTRELVESDNQAQIGIHVASCSATETSSPSPVRSAPHIPRCGITRETDSSGNNPSQGATERILPSGATMADMLALAKPDLDKTSFARVLRGE